MTPQSFTAAAPDQGKGGHTPGPWAYVSGPSLHGRYHTVEGADEAMVCECYEGTEAEQEANARLIAAAPELLEALEAALDAIHRYEVDVDADAHVPVRHREMMRKAYTAIAKARGAS